MYDLSYSAVATDAGTVIRELSPVFMLVMGVGIAMFVFAAVLGLFRARHGYSELHRASPYVEFPGAVPLGGGRVKRELYQPGSDSAVPASSNARTRAAFVQLVRSRNAGPIMIGEAREKLLRGSDAGEGVVVHSRLGGGAADFAEKWDRHRGYS